MNDNKKNNIELEFQLSEILKNLYKENSTTIYKNIDENDFNYIINLINEKNLNNLLNLKEIDSIEKYLKIIFIFSNDYKILCYLFIKCFNKISFYKFLFEIYFLNYDIKSIDNIIIDIIKLYSSILPLQKDEIKLFYQKISNNYYRKISDDNFDITENSLKKIFDLFYVLNNNINNKTDYLLYKYYNNPIEMELFTLPQQILSKGITIILNFNILNLFFQNDNITNIELIKLENTNKENFIINCQYIKNSNKFIFTSSNYNNKENKILFEFNLNKNKKNNIKIFFSLTNEHKKFLFFHFYAYNYSQEEDENELIIPYNLTMKKYPFKNYDIFKIIKNISLFKNFFGEIISIEGMFYGLNSGFFDYIIEENIINKKNFNVIFEKIKENILEDQLYKKKIDFDLEKNQYFFLYNNNIRNFGNNKYFEFECNKNKKNILDFYENCKLVLNEDTFFIKNLDNLTYFTFYNSFNNFLPLFDIFLKYQDYINFNDFLEKIFLIIKNLFDYQKNIIDLKEKEIIKILSLFLEEFNEKFFNENLLKIFNEIYYILKADKIKNTFKKYILTNEAIINKFKNVNPDLILNDDKIINNILEKNNLSYESNKYNCCEFHNKNEINNIEDYNLHNNSNNIFKKLFNLLEQYYLINQDELFNGIKNLINLLLNNDNICPCLINCIICFIKNEHSKIKFEKFLVSNIFKIFFKLLTKKYIDIKINVLDFLFDIIDKYYDYLSEIHFNEEIPKNLFIDFNYSNKIEFNILMNKLLFYISPSNTNIYEKIELNVYSIIIYILLNLCEKNNFFQLFYYLMLDNYYKKNINLFYNSLYYLLDLFNKDEKLISVVLDKLKKLYSEKYIYNETYEKYFYNFLYYLNCVFKNDFEYISEQNIIIKNKVQENLYNFFNDIIIFGQLTVATEESRQLIKLITDNEYEFVILELLYDFFKYKYEKFIQEKKNYDDMVDFCNNFKLFLLFLEYNSYNNIKNNNYIIQNIILKTLKMIKDAYKENEDDEFNLFKITFLRELLINLSHEHFLNIEYFHSAFKEYHSTNQLKGILISIDSLSIKYTESADKFILLKQNRINENQKREKIHKNILFFDKNNNDNEQNEKKENEFKKIFKKIDIFYLYMKLKKSCFYFNGYWTNNELFFEKKNLSYKIKNFYTNNLNRPLLYPIIDFNNYQNKYLKGDEIYKINRENNLNLNINKEIFEENINKHNIKKDDYDFHLKKKYKNYDIFYCCLVKYFQHIKGFIVLKEEELYFVSFYNQTNKFCYKNTKCYGVLYENQEFKKFPKKFKININNIVLISKKNYFYGDTGLEIYTNEGKIFYFNFTDSDYINKIFEHDIIKKFTTFKNSYERNLEYDNLFYNQNSNYFYLEFYDKIGVKNEINFVDLLTKWNLLKISNILFLNLLNILGNRSYIDLYQYMIFPKIILNIDNSLIIREFELTIKTLNKKYFENESYEFYQTFSSVCENLKNIFPFVFQYLDTFYCNERITSFEDNNENKQMFHESTPEFLYLPEIFKNKNNLEELEGKIKENYIISEYIEKEYNELELSDINKINIWLDNIFGINQKNDKEIDEKYINNKNNNEKYHNNETLLLSVEYGLVPYQITNKKLPKVNNIMKDNISRLLNVEKYESKIKEISDFLKIIIFNKIKIFNKNEFLSINKQYLYLSSKNKKIYFSRQFNQISLYFNFSNDNELNYFSNNYIIFSNKGDYCFISGQINAITFLVKRDEYKEHIINLRKFDLYTIINSLCLIENKISYLICGDINGNIIIFKLANIFSLDLNKIEENFLLLYKYFNAHLLKINHIYYNEDLNMFCSCSQDNFMNVYIFPECKIVNSLKNEYSIDYSFIIENPYPLILYYSHKSKKLLIYSLNNEFIKEEIINNFISPKIYKDDLQLSYLTYLSDLNTLTIYPLNIYGKNKVLNINIKIKTFNYDISNDLKYLIFSEYEGKKFYILYQSTL